MVRLSRASIAFLAVALVATGCTMKKTDQPPLSGPSELALSLTLYANPDTVTQDGVSQSQIFVLARDAAGQPVKSLSMHVGAATNNSATSVGQLSAQTITTDSDGRAAVVYTAPPPPPGNADTGTIVTLGFTPTGTDFANAVTRSVQIRLVPPGGPVAGPVANFSFTPFNPSAYSTVTFNAGASRSDVPLVAFTWDFGDGGYGSGVTPQHQYRQVGSYTVRLTVTDAAGRTSNPSVQTVTVGDVSGPTADFVFSPTNPAPDQTIFLNAANSTAASGHVIVDFAWDLGNGRRVKGMTAQVSYPLAGTYTITLTVTDDIGQTATKVQTVTVK